MAAGREPEQMTMAELADYAHEVGIDNVAHLSRPELVEAIEQQRETNGILRSEGETVKSSKPSDESSLPGDWENFR